MTIRTETAMRRKAWAMVRTRLAPAMALLSRARQAYRGRNALWQLYMLDDHLLADIGIERADLDRAAAVGVLDDPTRQLDHDRFAAHRHRIRPAESRFSAAGRRA